LIFELEGQLFDISSNLGITSTWELHLSSPKNHPHRAWQMRRADEVREGPPDVSESGGGGNGIRVGLGVGWGLSSRERIHIPPLETENHLQKAPWERDTLVPRSVDVFFFKVLN